MRWAGPNVAQGDLVLDLGAERSRSAVSSVWADGVSDGRSPRVRAPRSAVAQSSLPSLCPVEASLAALSEAGTEERGAVWTRRPVVGFILDLVGYTPDRPLHRQRLLEFAVGRGAFLFPVVERLLAAWRAAGGTDPLTDLSGCIVAFELHRETHERTSADLVALLMREGVPTDAAPALAARWLRQGDFLLAAIEGGPFDYNVGNPPYLRLERVPEALTAAYRARYATLYDRADLYVAFLERGLRLLAPGGVQGVICADRWTKNKYGGPLRALVAEGGYRLRAYVDMTDVPAFESEVVAYPAVTVIAREASGPTRVAHRPEITAEALSRLVSGLAEASPASGDGAREIARVPSGSAPWLLGAADQTSVLRRLEAAFPTLEEAGCAVGIGVATGDDASFIAPYDALAVEDSRKLPLVTTRDICTGEVAWRGLGVVNPWADGGGLVALRDYPRLARHLEERRGSIAARHCARRTPDAWYKTIDRITPALARRPKLLIPDIKGEANVAFEEGRLYPHHNLYHVVSDEWDLRALQAVLRSSVARLFVATYSTPMRGGYLRWQAQYLRRIRLPRWQDVPDELRLDLASAARAGDLAAANVAAFRLYGLTDAERESLGGNGS